MKNVFGMCCLVAATVFSSSVLAGDPVKEPGTDAHLLMLSSQLAQTNALLKAPGVDERLQSISTQLAQTNALLAKIAGESPESATLPGTQPKALDGAKNECSASGADARRYPEGSVIEEKGKTYKCVVSPHWQAQ